MALTSLQFELWEDCNSMCKFCYLDDFRHTSNQIKIDSLKKTYDKICDMSIYKHYNCLSYIGGEFFQGQMSDPEVNEMFFKVMRKTAELSDADVLEQVWVTTTMTIGDQADMYKMIELFKDKSKLWICTSYDTAGRFHTEKMHETWKYHMKHIKELYPEINLNVCLILSGDLITKYLSKKFTFKQFMEKYQTTVFLKTPGIPFKSKPTIECKQELNKKMGIYFYPRRSDFLQFLVLFKQQEGEYMLDKMYNIQCRADDLLKNTNDDKDINNISNRDKHKEMIETTTDDTGKLWQPTNTCGHLMRYAPYVDSDACFLCDKFMIQGNDL